MADNRAQDVIGQVESLTGQFGVSVSILRTIVDPNDPTDAFGQPMNQPPPTPINTKVIIDSQKINTLPTLIGGKPKEELRLIANQGVFINNDEVQYGDHAYKVNFVQPVPFMGQDVVDFVHAQREVDA